MSVLKGDGAGHFAAPYITEVIDGHSHFSITAADFDHDNDLDIAVGNSSYQDQIVNVMLNGGDGLFAVHTGYSTGHDSKGIEGLAADDFDGDGNVDIVASSFGGGVDIFLGDGEGGFQVSTMLAISNNPSYIVTNDLDGDGDRDLIVTQHYGGKLVVALGDGLGGFGTPVAYGPHGSDGGALADIDGDGKLDVVTPSTIAFGHGDGTFAASQSIRSHDTPNSVVVGLFNSDAKPDVATQNYFSRDVSVLVNQTGVVTLARSSAAATIVDDDAPQLLRYSAGADVTSSTHPGASFAASFAVVATNARGNPVEGAVVTFSAPASGVSGTFGGGQVTASVTSSAWGVATAPALTAGSALGTFNLVASVAGESELGFALNVSTSGPSYSASEYFPMEHGNTWSFSGQQRINQANPRSFVDVRRSRRATMGGVAVTEFVDLLDRPGYTGGGYGTLVRDYVADSTNGLRLYYQNTGQAAITFAQHPLPIMQASAYVGQVLSWANTPISVDVDGRHLAGTSSGTSTVDAIQPFELPGGRWIYTIKLTIDHTEHYTVDGVPVNIHETEVVLLGRGIGMVSGTVNAIAVASDGEDTDTQEVWSTQTIGGIEVDALCAAPAQVLGASAAPGGGLNMTFRNVNTAGVVMQQEGGQAGWAAVDLQAATGCPEIKGNVVTWVGPIDGVSYAAAVSDYGLAMFTAQNGGGWTYRNLSSEVTGSALIAGNLTTFTSVDGIVSIAGISSVGDVIQFSQVSPGSYAWTAANRGDDLRAQGLTPPKFAGQITSFVTSWNALNVVGLDASGQIQAVWWHHTLDTGGKWTTSNLSEQTGAPQLTGGLTVWLTSWNAINIAGADADGNLSTTWWVAGYNGDRWQTSDLTSVVPGGGPKLQASSMTSWVTPWGAMNIAGRESDGSITAYWWVPTASGGDAIWHVSRLSATGDTPTTGPVTAITALGGDSSMSILGTSANGDVIRQWWSPATNVWAQQNLTQIAVSA
ncbi:MAG: VCBS repeat-containing protein [Phycisphaerales bacterium]|nr:VCBS repeat-containing protein [Phycisphaerales bacterium]